MASPGFYLKSGTRDSPTREIPLAHPGEIEMTGEDIGEDGQHHAVNDNVSVFYRTVHAQVAKIPHSRECRVKLTRRKASLGPENDMRPAIDRLSLRFVN